MQKVKKIPQRQCVGCREMKDKKSLLRVVKSPEGAVSLDFVGKKPGRGVKRPKKQTETPEERKQDRRAGAKAERGPRKGEKTGKGGPRGKTSARPVPGEKNQRRSGTYEKSAGGKTQGRTASGKAAEGRSGLRKSGPRPFKSDRPKAKRNPFAHSRPVKKGKGSFRKKES